MHNLFGFIDRKFEKRKLSEFIMVCERYKNQTLADVLKCYQQKLIKWEDRWEDSTYEIRQELYELSITDVANGLVTKDEQLTGVK